MGRRFSLQSKQMTLSAVPAGRVILIGGDKKDYRGAYRVV